MPTAVYNEQEGGAMGLTEAGFLFLADALHGDVGHKTFPLGAISLSYPARLFK